MRAIVSAGGLGSCLPEVRRPDEAIQVRRRGAGLRVGDAQSEDEQVLFAEISEHARAAHGMDEVPPEVVDQIQAVIIEV